MIQSNELRVGNRFIRELHTSRGLEYDHDFVLTEGKMAELFGDKILLALQDLFPIPLTPEILEKSGFKYGKSEGISSFDDSEREGDTHYWDLSIKRTDLIDSHEISLVKWGEEEYFTFQLGRGTYRQKIKYVHHLQNLIYALAGVEWEVIL